MAFSQISQQLLFSTVRIETSYKSGTQGCGTGFVFVYERGERYYPFLVTNKHVVKDAIQGNIYFHRGSSGQPMLGKGLVFNVDDLEGIWHGHPDDQIDVSVATLMPMLEHLKKLGHEPFFRPIYSGLIPTSEQVDIFEAIEEVVFVGYPNGIWDQDNLLPILRRGTTATPISIDFQKRKIFLIDASVFQGSSGSPVFLYTSGPYLDQGNISYNATQKKLFFLGIISAGYFRQDINRLEMLPEPMADVPGTVSQQMIDLGVVFKSSSIIEAATDLIQQAGEPDSLPN